jgi:CTP:molybdopterin cytidylyltransferase MocA
MRRAAPEWTAIVLAGHRPGGDPLARQFGETYKGRIRIKGKPMISHVVSTLAAEPRVGRILILAQEPEAVLAGELGWIAEHPMVALAASDDGISRSICAIAGSPAASWPVLVTTADHPLLATEDISQLIDGVGEADLAIGMVERSVLLGRYPENRRTWLRFSDGAFTGANLFALRTDRVKTALELWATVEQERKVAHRLVRRFGLWLAIRALTRTISLSGALAKAGKKLGLAVRPVLLDNPEAGIDVDKPEDYALVETIMAERV